MPFNVQEEATERALKIMLKVPAITGDIIVAALKLVLKKLEERQPVGKQQLKKLIRGGAALQPADMKGDIDLKLLERMARKHGVGFSVLTNPDKSVCVYFQSAHAEQMKECVNSYIQHKLAREKGKESITQRLERAKQTLVESKEIEGRSADRQMEHVIGKERSR